jgi:serine/threonine protein kinase
MTDKWRRPDESEDLHSKDVSNTSGRASSLEPMQPENALTHQPSTSAATLVQGFSDMVEVASGASGTVYAGRRATDGAAVAIKIFKKDLTPDSDAIRRFDHEVATLSKLSHPNIVKILGSGQSQAGESYIVMELVNGVSLRTILETEGVFPPRKAALVAREICRALEAAHAEGIVHRDLKPNNIILDDRNFAKVVDFGIAKAIGSSTDTITQYGAIIGTPNYMSPEQCLGERVEQQSDIYSLGCTMFEMLTGNKAFDSVSPIEAIAKHVNADRSFIKQKLVSTGAPTELQTIITRCLEREPAKRYRTITEVDHELSAFMLGKPLTFSHATAPNKQLNYALYATAAAIAIFGLGWMNATVWKVPNPLASLSTLGAQVVIRSKDDGKVLFADPSAKDLKEAVVHAAERKISLSHADLRDAELTQIRLNSADLSFADLTGARLVQAKLTDVDLHNAILSGSRLTQATLMRVDMRNVKLDSSDLTQCRAPAINLSGADLSSVRMVQAGLENSSCVNTNFSYGMIGQANFDGANCSYANFTGVRTDHDQFRNAIMTGARLTYYR